MTTELLSDVSSEIDRMNLLINDLLSLVRLDEEKTTTLAFAQINLSSILMQVCDNLVPITFERNIELKLSVLADIYYMGDADKMKRLFINLIDNAIKYSEDNSIVEVFLQTKANGVSFVVKDCGVGIAKDDIPYIFDRFYRVDKARARVTGGTGLGLSIVKNIVLLHSGDISIDSTPGTGTTINVFFPTSTRKDKV